LTAQQREEIKIMIAESDKPRLMRVLDHLGVAASAIKS
jgi:hypothetical protein